MRRHGIAAVLLLATPCSAKMPEAQCEATVKALEQVLRSATSLTRMVGSLELEPTSASSAERSLKRFDASRERLGPALVDFSLGSKEAIEALRKECGAG
jgi:hypothetical protein